MEKDNFKRTFLLPVSLITCKPSFRVMNNLIIKRFQPLFLSIKLFLLIIKKTPDFDLFCLFRGFLFIKSSLSVFMKTPY